MAELTEGWPPEKDPDIDPFTNTMIVDLGYYQGLELLAAVGRALLALRKLDAERVDPHATYEWIVRRDAAKRAFDQAMAAWEEAGNDSA